jgi:hypothetical protein
MPHEEFLPQLRSQAHADGQTSGARRHSTHPLPPPTPSSRAPTGVSERGAGSRAPIPLSWKAEGKQKSAPGEPHGGGDEPSRGPLGDEEGKKRDFMGAQRETRIVDAADPKGPRSRKSWPHKPPPPPIPPPRCP